MTLIGSYSKTIQVLRKAHTVAISGHVNPDGDSLGSLLALGLALKKIGKRVSFICQDRIPKNYLILPGIKHVKKNLKKSVDLAVAVDCGSIKLLGPAIPIFQKAKKTLSIDHHEFRKEFADVDLIDFQASSTSDMVYMLIKKMRIPLDKAIATNILTSIIVETNSFRLPSTNGNAFTLCAEMLKTGIDYNLISQVTYWSKTKPVLKLSQIFFSRIRFAYNDRLAYASLSQSDFKKTSTDMEDADFLIEELRSQQSTLIALFFREQKDGFLRVGFRSKGKINIAALAEEYGGGGHYDMAGCLIPKKRSLINEIIKKAGKLLP